MHKLEETLEWYCERIEKELTDLKSKLSKNEMTMPSQDLETMDYLLHSMKSLKTVMAMLEHEDDYPSESKGYSGRYYEPRYTTPRYSGEDYSGRRMGRGYSRDSRDNNDSVRILESMMSRARTEGEAMAIQDAINAVNRMEG